jgi:hypothetical protein
MLAKRSWPPVGDREFDFLRDALASKLFLKSPFPDPPKDLDWERLYTILRYHRLSAHFYVIGKSKRNNWPASFRERLKLDRYGLIIYSEKFMYRIEPVLAALTETNIPIIVLKGWALIHTIYGGDYGQRDYSDIDILVHPQNADKVEMILKKLGWQAEEEQRPGFTRSYYNAQAYYLEQTEFRGRGYSIGFHWGLLRHPVYNPEQIDVGGIFRRAHPLRIAEIPVLAMSVEDYLVYACAHIILQHRSEESLLRYYEIAAVIRAANSSLDWQDVEEHAKCWKLVLSLRKVVKKVEEFWPGTVPSSAINAIEKIRSAQSEKFIHRWYETTNYNPSFEHVLTWLTISGIKRRFSLMLEETFPNRSFIVKNYGPIPYDIWPWLYIRRFGRVLERLLKQKI